MCTRNKRDLLLTLYGCQKKGVKKKKGKRFFLYFYGHQFSGLSERARESMVSFMA
jgi:hypothetical protein